MTELLTAAQMRSLEQAAIESGAVTGLELMERAGVGVVDAVLEEWPELATGAHRAVVLCGPGNNGGDGFVVARLLAERGWEVEVFFYGVKDKLPVEALRNYERFAADHSIVPLGFPVATAAAQAAFAEAAGSTKDIAANPEQDDAPPFLVVDALFGIGLRRPITGLSDLMQRMDYLSVFPDLNNRRIVSVDVPSGFDTDSGAIIWSDTPTQDPIPAIFSDLVVTFHAPKPVHKKLRTQDFKVVVKDIGLPVSVPKKSPPEA
ncbi:MAG: NAD(P)H-hydrate epimerase [Pseudomonadota bacterium]